jgi:hypothetical protein
MAEFGMYPVGGSAQTAMESAVLVNAYRPFQLWTRRVIVSGGTWDPFSGSSGAQYFLAPADQRLEVTLVPTPLRVAGPKTVEPGQPGQFTAEIVGPFEFRRQTPWGDSIQWQYYPGDTLPEPNRYLGGTYLDECTNKPTCSYTPTRNGRMGVHAWVQYNHLEVRSHVIRLQPAELKLECKEVGRQERVNTVVRGGNIACKVRTEPEAAGAIEVEEWRFTGTDSRGEAYRYPPEDESPITESSWGGEMALGGTISVRARIDGGTPVVKSAAITVEDRDWAAASVAHTLRMVTLDNYPDPASPPPPYPRAEHDLGRAIFGGTYPAPTEPGVVTYITDYGPNHGLAYLARIPIDLDIAIFLHPQMNTGSTFYNRQRPSASGVAMGAPCVQSDFDRYRQLILAHEGYPVNPRSHSGVFLREFSERAGPEVESFVVPNDQLGALMDLYVEKLVPVISHADAVSDTEVDSRYRVPFGCNFNWRR